MGKKLSHHKANPEPFKVEPLSFEEIMDRERKGLSVNDRLQELVH